MVMCVKFFSIEDMDGRSDAEDETREATVALSMLRSLGPGTQCAASIEILAYYYSEIHYS